MITPKHPDAVFVADMAFLETVGSTADKVSAAIAAYEWAIEQRQKIGDMEVYPSLDQLREALK